MKPNYKNWVPKGLVISVVASSVLFAILFGLSLWTNLFTRVTQCVFSIIFGTLTVVMVIYAAFIFASTGIHPFLTTESGGWLPV